MEKHDATARIAQLNDMHRQAPGLYGIWHQTQGIEALPTRVQSQIREAIETYNTWDKEDNDPYGEHDFGVIEIEGERMYWKISYYDRNMEYHSPNPADPTVTCRVLTIMLADEY